MKNINNNNHGSKNISEEQSQSWILEKYFREGKTVRGLEVVEALGGFNDTMVEMFGAKVDFR